MSISLLDNTICPVCKKNPGILMLNLYGPCSQCVPVVSAGVVKSGGTDRYEPLEYGDPVPLYAKSVAWRVSHIDYGFELCKHICWRLNNPQSTANPYKPAGIAYTMSEWGIHNNWSWTKKLGHNMIRPPSANNCHSIIDIQG